MPASIIMNATSTLTEGSTADAVQLSSPLSVSFNGSASQMQPLDIILKPLQTQSLIQAPPSLNYSSSSVWNVINPGTSNASAIRLVGGPNTFRISRNIGTNSATSVNVIRLSDTVARVSLAAGTLTTSPVLVGDQLILELSTSTFSSPFAIANQGLFLTVVGKGLSSIDVVDNGSLVPESSVILGSSFAFALKVLSSNVMANDVLYVSSDVFGYSNRGKFVITAASDSYVEIVNSSATLETNITNVPDGGVLVGRDIAQYLFLTASSAVEILLVNQVVGGGVLVSPESGSNALALLTLNSPVLSLHNPSLTDDIRIIAHVALSPASGC